ncbi:hypothetical protein HN51_022686, partial [Arachis hypogaea]
GISGSIVIPTPLVTLIRGSRSGLPSGDGSRDRFVHVAKWPAYVRLVIFFSRLLYRLSVWLWTTLATLRWPGNRRGFEAQVQAVDKG